MSDPEEPDCPICQKRNFLMNFILARASTQVEPIEPIKVEAQFAIEADEHWNMLMACLEDCGEDEEPEGGLMMNG